MLPTPILVSTSPITASDCLEEIWYYFKGRVIKREYSHHSEGLKVLAGIPGLPKLDFSKLSKEEQSLLDSHAAGQAKYTSEEMVDFACKVFNQNYGTDMSIVERARQLIEEMDRPFEFEADVQIEWTEGNYRHTDCPYCKGDGGVWNTCHHCGGHGSTMETVVEPQLKIAVINDSIQILGVSRTSTKVLTI
jgi:hypothetical protein